MPWSALCAAVIAFFRALSGGKRSDPMLEAEKHDATIAEEQAAIVADRNRPDAIDCLRDDRF